MKYLLILSALFASLSINGQSFLPVFGDFTKEEIDLKECDFDKNAEAVILFDDAASEYDDNYRLITHRRIRIKIFTQRELDRGNIRIRFYSKNKFEYITNIKGVTFNQEGGKPVFTYLDKKGIYTENEDGVYSSIKFALPNVKPGSIVEYEYDSYMQNYNGLDSWRFQNELPTIKSCYLLAVLPDTEFQYSVQKKVNYPITIKPLPASGRMYYEMNNIPGLKFEPYMDAVNDYLQKVEFQLSKYTNQYGRAVKVNQTWKDLAKDLLDEKEFGGMIRKDLNGMDEIRKKAVLETSPAARVALIYNYVRDNFRWDGYYAKYSSGNLKSFLEKKVGHAADINLLLINLLQSSDLEVYPLLVAERDYGKIDTAYPFLDRFNKVGAYVVADNKVFILDATQRFCPPGLTPYSLLNTTAFLVDKKNSRLISITSDQDSYKNNIVVNAKVEKGGILKGKAVISSSGYAKQVRSEKAITDAKNYTKNILQDQGSELVIDNCFFDNLDNGPNPLVQNVDFHNDLNESGEFVFLTYNMFTGLLKSPFVQSERFTNINFGYPYDLALKVDFELPEQYKIDKLPADKTVRSNDNRTSVSRKLKMDKNILSAVIEFKQTTTLVHYDRYESLKSLYQQIVDLLNEPVIVKIAK